MNEKVLDEVSMRFIIPLADVDKTFPERLYFLIEEAYWFYLDFYKSKIKLTFRYFAESLLKHNSLKFRETDLKGFLKYKKEIPVYGALLINQKFDKVLLVQGYYTNNFFFPKGKKNRDEEPKDCAIREVSEEIGYDIEKKVLDNGIRISPRFVVFPVINISEKTYFETMTRNEIKNITWVPIKAILSGQDANLKQVKDAFGKCKDVIKRMDEKRFKFDRSRFEKIFAKKMC